MSRQIIFAGSRAQRPGRGGQMWVFLQYLLGFRRLGYDVLYVDALESRDCVDQQGQPCEVEDSYNLRYFVDAMRRYGLDDAWALLCDGGQRALGIKRDALANRVEQACCVIHVMGFLRNNSLFDGATRSVFLDIDPGFGQMWKELGLADIYAGHDHFLTVGMNVGGQGSQVPTCGLSWTPTPPPVVLDRWPVHENCPDAPFTSVCTWRGIFGPIDYRGHTYGLRVHEFRKFMTLPKLTKMHFQLALDIDPCETSDLALLEQNDWDLIDPNNAVATPEAYQRYIQASFAEFGVAKSLYVETGGGWISDRTVCYLASGKPALVQDTGLRNSLPDREGLVLFSDLDGARRGVDDIRKRYEHHCTAARRIAEQHFDSDKVLPRFLRAIGVG
jgi:hypothetical protein